MSAHAKQEIIRYRITRAKETLKEVDIHIQNELWNTAVNRLYYASFYAVLALLTQHDINTKTHSGARQMFGLHFIKPGIISEESGEFYTRIFDVRQTGDYEDFIIIGREDAIGFMAPAHILIQEIEQVLAKQ